MADVVVGEGTIKREAVGDGEHAALAFDFKSDLTRLKAYASDDPSFGLLGSLAQYGE